MGILSKDENDLIEKAIFEAVEAAIKEIGIDEFKKCSFFGSNGIELTDERQSLSIASGARDIWV